MMMHQKAPTQEEAVARTWVIWDIKSCPVPSGCDARRVAPCIKRALENLGYSGPLTITANGISLHHIPLDVEGIATALAKLGDDNTHLANILLISARDFSDVLEYLQRRGFNILRQILYDDSLGAFPTTTEVESLWKSFLTDTMDLEEKSSETRECDWLCSVCADAAFRDLDGKGFEILTKHLRSPEHRERMLDYLPRDYELKREEDKEEVEAARMQLRHEVEAARMRLWHLLNSMS